MAVIPRQIAKRTLEVVKSPTYPVLDATAKAVTGFGATVEDVAETWKTRQETVDRFNSLQGLQRLGSGLSGAATDALATAPPDGAGYLAGMQQREQEAFDGFLQTVPAHLRPEFEQRLETMRAENANVWASVEAKQTREYQRGVLTENVDNARVGILEGGQERLEAYQRGIEEEINSSTLPPAEKRELIAESRRALQQAAAREVLARQQGAAAGGGAPAAGGGVAGAGGGSVRARPIGAAVQQRASAAMSHLMERGLTQVQAAGVVGNLIQESNLNPTIVGDQGTSVGIAQWRGDRLTALKAFAGDRWNTVEGQLDFVLHEMDGREKAAGDRLRSAETVDDASAAFISFERPQGWTANNPRGGHGWANRVGYAGTLAGLTDIPTAGGDPFSGDPRFADLTYEDRIGLLEEAERQRRVNARQYEDGLADETAWIRAGNAPTGRYNGDTAVAVLGNTEAAANVQHEIDQAIEYAAAAKAIQFASPEELALIAANATSALSSPENYVDNARQAQEIRGLMEDRQKAVEEDPAKWVMQDPGVNAAYNAMIRAQRPGAGDAAAIRASTAAYSASSLSLQDQMGIPQSEQRLLPDAAVAAIAETVKVGSGQNVAQTMRSLAAQWGSQWPRVFEELSEDLPAVALVVGNMDQPDQMLAAERLADAAKVGREAYQDTLPADKVTRIREALPVQLQDLVGTFQPTAQGGGRTMTAVFEAVRLLAMSYARDDGDDGDRAVQRAVQDIVDKKYQINGTFRVPRDFDVDDVSRGAAAAQAVATGANFDIPLNVIGLTEEEVRASYMETLKADGYWVTSEDETGLTLYEPTTRSPVTINGEPMVIPFAELEKYARARFAPSAVGVLNQMGVTTVPTYGQLQPFTDPMRAQGGPFAPPAVAPTPAGQVAPAAGRSIGAEAVPAVVPEPGARSASLPLNRLRAAGQQASGPASANPVAADALPAAAPVATTPAAALALPPAAIAAMPAAAAQALAAVSPAAAKRVEAVSAGRAITPATATRVTPSQAALWTPDTAAAVSSTALAALEPEAFAAIPPKAVAGIPSEALAALPPSTLAAMTARQAAQVTPEAAAAITPEALAAMRPASREALPAPAATPVQPAAAGQVAPTSAPAVLPAAAPATEPASISPTAARALQPAQAAELTPVQARAMQPVAAAALTPVQAAALPPAAIAAMPVATAQALATVSPAAAQRVRAVTQGRAVTPTAAAQVTPRAAAAMTPDAVAAMSAEAVAALKPGTLAALMPEAVGAMSPAAVGALRPSAAAAITPQQAAVLTPEALAAISPRAVEAMSPAAAERLPPAAVAAMPPAVAKAFAAVSQTAALRVASAERGRLVTPQVAAQMKPDAAGLITPYAMGAISPEAVTALTPEALAALRPTAVAAMSPEAIAAVTPQQAEALTPRQAAQVTPEAAAALTPEALQAMRPAARAALPELPDKPELPEEPAPTPPTRPGYTTGRRF